MSAGAWVALITTGLFCTLSSYSAGAHWPVARMMQPAKPVVLWKRDRRAECGDDFLCLLKWANEGANK